MPIRILQIDAFTSTPYTGNPAAVALIDGGEVPAWPADASLQALALEMNLSETAFPRRRRDGQWDLRWFTPATEVDLCGHATLATAHALFQLGLVEGTEITFHTRSGPLVCRAARRGGAIAMDFPRAEAEPCGPVEGMAEALGAEVVDQGRSFDLLAQLSSPQEVAACNPISPPWPASTPALWSSPPPVISTVAPPTSCPGCSVPGSASPRIP